MWATQGRLHRGQLPRRPPGGRYLGERAMEPINPIVRRWQQEAARDPEGFWARAAEQLPWFRRWDRVFEWDPPTFRWFIGGQTYLSYNCLDHHVARGWGGHAALVAETEWGERRVYTYAQLLEAVKRAAAALRGLGVQKGDRVAIYMPTCPEAIITMLACARIGAIHLVVFAGFGAMALGERMALAGAKVLFTADVTYRKGRDVPLKGLVDEALTVDGVAAETVVILRRTGEAIPMQTGRDMTWEEF